MSNYPYGPAGPDYPPSFRFWYLLIVLGLLALGLALGGCTRRGQQIGTDIIVHCRTYLPDRREVDRCFTDSEFALSELE